MLGCCEHDNEPCIKCREVMELHSQRNVSVELVITYNEL